MAAQEIPLVGYQPKLLNRVEVAEGTRAFQATSELKNLPVIDMGMTLAWDSPNAFVGPVGG